MRDAFSRQAEYEWRLSNHYVSHCQTCVVRDAFSRQAEYEWRLSNHYVSHCRTCVVRDMQNMSGALVIIMFLIVAPVWC